MGDTMRQNDDYDGRGVEGGEEEEEEDPTVDHTHTRYLVCVCMKYSLITFCIINSYESQIVCSNNVRLAMPSALVLLFTLGFAALYLTASPYALPFNVVPLHIDAPVCLTGRSLDINLTGQIVHVIGGRSGNAKATAEVLASRGATVVISTRYPSKAIGNQFPTTVLELGNHRNDMNKYWRDFVRRFGRMADVVVDIGVTFYTGFMSDFSREQKEYCTRMYVTDPLELYYEAMEMSKEFNQSLTISIAESVVGYDALPMGYQLYHMGKKLKRDLIKNFPVLEGPMKYPNVRIIGVACAYVDTNVAVNAVNPSALKGNAYFQNFFDINILLNKNFGIAPSVYGMSQLEAIYFNQYPKDSNICLVPHKGDQTTVLGLYDLLYGMYQIGNSTQFVANTQFYFRQIGLGVENYVSPDAIMYRLARK
jgi:hypothetical protein